MFPKDPLNLVVKQDIFHVIKNCFITYVNKNNLFTLELCGTWLMAKFCCLLCKSYINAKIDLMKTRLFQVVVNYVSSVDAAEGVAQEISALGGEALVVSADVGKKEDIDNMFKAVKDQWGTIDVVVNNAGIGLNHCACQGCFFFFTAN